MGEVLLRCVKEGKKLRVKIVTEGYYNNANCQFPRDIRVDGKMFKVPLSAVSLVQGPRGKYFYKVNKQHIEEVQDLPDKVYGDEEVDCVVCLSEQKTRVFVPCGHYCVCDVCESKLEKKCPMCRQEIRTSVTRDVIE
jgi:hypothetical protein